MNPTRSFNAGHVLGHSFKIFFRNIVPIGVLSLLLVGVPSLLMQLFYVKPVSVRFLSGESNFDTGQYFIVMFGSSFLSYILIILLMASVTNAALNALRGQDVRFVDSLINGLKPIFTLVLLLILTSFAMLFGLILFIVPAIILAIMWAVCVPAVVNEHLGPIKALGRSRALTKGYRWQIFAVFLILILISFVPPSIIGVLALGSTVVSADTIQQPLATPIWYDVSVITLSCFIYGLFGVTVTILYNELRRVKEGLSMDELSTAFD